MMNPAITATLNQQLMSGSAFGQQGMLAESQGNPMAAAQLYEQAIGWIQQSMATAQQWGMFIPDGVHAALANAHACAARAKTTLGQPPAAWPHWNQALFELNQAIRQNPEFAGYHAAAGMVLLSMGNLHDAWRAFATVQQLQPGEPMSQQMLMTLQNMRPVMPQGMPQGMPQPMPGWGAMQPQGVPGAAMPGMQQPGAWQPAGAQASAPPAHPDWMKTVGDACTMLDKVFKTVGGFQDMVGRFE